VGTAAWGFRHVPQGASITCVCHRSADHEGGLQQKRETAVVQFRGGTGCTRGLAAGVIARLTKPKNFRTAKKGQGAKLKKRKKKLEKDAGGRDRMTL